MVFPEFRQKVTGRRQTATGTITKTTSASNLVTDPTTLTPTANNAAGGRQWVQCGGRPDRILGEAEPGRHAARERSSMN
jgi:hypothetical protein